MELFKLKKYIQNLINPPKKNTYCKNHLENKIYDKYNIFYDNFISFDNKKIYFTYYKIKIFFEQSDNSHTTFIYIHSHGSNRLEGLNLINYCYKNDFNLLIYDSRGCGQSDETFTSFGYNEKYDLLFIIFILNIKYNVCKYILWGRSMGANTIIYLLYEIIINMKNEINSLYFNNRNDNNIFENNNLFLKNNLEIFTKKNIKIKNKTKLNIIILKIILDSPYSSFKSLIKDSLKNKNFLLNFVNDHIYKTFENIFYEETKIELKYLRKVKNKFKQINIPMIMLISQNDEKIQFKRFKVLFDNYNSDYKKLILIKEKHNEKRNNQVINFIFEYIKTSKLNDIYYKIILKENIIKLNLHIKKNNIFNKELKYKNKYNHKPNHIIQKDTLETRDLFEIL